MKDGQTIGQWLKWDFEANGALILKNTNRSLIYLEDENGYWSKYERDFQDKEIYYENSDGTIIDKRPPEVIEHTGRKYQLIP